MGSIFSSPARQASCNYGIGNDGTIICILEEEYHPWTSSSYANDNVAVTFEVSNSYAGGDWPIGNAAWNSMIALAADICKRYNIVPYYDGTANGTFTEHRMFAPTGCPGEYIHSRMYQIVEEVKQKMNGTGGTWVKSEKTGKWWYQYAGGGYPASKWEKINDKWYYFDKDGWMVEGWVKWSDGYYYLNPESGDMRTGWLELKGKKYYLDPDNGGKMVTGFFLGKKSQKWYCFDDHGVLIKDDKLIVVNSKNGQITIK